MREALGLLTTLGGAREPTARAVPWFPVVGALLGAGVGGAWWGAAELWPPAVAAVLVVAVDLALTGMLHVDGLADSADGLLPHASRERRLAIMRSPDVGAYGVALVVAVLLARATVFGSNDPAPVLVIAAWAAARTVAALALLSVPYARSDGLAAPLLDASPSAGWQALAGVALVVTIALGAAAEGVAGAAGVTATVLAAATIVGLASRRLGGFTGDVLGAAIILGETAGLVVWSARW